MAVAICAYMQATQLMDLNWEGLWHVHQHHPGSWLHTLSHIDTDTHTHTHQTSPFQASLHVYFNLNSMSKVLGREAVHRAPNLVGTREGAKPSMFSI